MYRIGSRRIVIGFVVTFSLLLIDLPVLAGGWASVTLDTLPVEPRAGETLQLGFVVRQHGQTPINTAWGSEPVRPYLLARNKVTGESIQVHARQDGPVGHFVLEVVFPSAGTWLWQIKPDPFAAIPEYLEPLTVLPALTTATEPTSETKLNSPMLKWWLAALALTTFSGLMLALWYGGLKRNTRVAIGIFGLVAVSLGILCWNSGAASTTGSRQATSEVALRTMPEADYGRALFVAKGCVGCHAYRGISDSVPGPVLGPTLTNYQPDPDFVRRWLRAPESIRPGTSMPNLGLSETEIEALIAFLGKYVKKLKEDP